MNFKAELYVSKVPKMTFKNIFILQKSTAYNNLKSTKAHKSHVRHSSSVTVVVVVTASHADEKKKD